MKYQIWATIEIELEDGEYIEADTWPVKVLVTNSREEAVEEMLRISMWDIHDERGAALDLLEFMESKDGNN